MVKDYLAGSVLRDMLPYTNRPAPKRLTSGKIPLAITLVVAATAYGLWQGTGSDETIAPNLPAPSPVAPAMTASTPATPAKKPAGLYADGSYTGATADAYYGTVQVQVTVAGGKISNVAFLQYPHDRSNSVVVNDQAMPYLIQEAIAAQSAQVSGVSGATFTSQAFAQSLASALAQAKA
jgi:uncharacterized protein with FMN-binding domain